MSILSFQVSLPENTRRTGSMFCSRKPIAVEIAVIEFGFVRPAGIVIVDGTGSMSHEDVNLTEIDRVVPDGRDLVVGVV